MAIGQAFGRCVEILRQSQVLSTTKGAMEHQSLLGTISGIVGLLLYVAAGYVYMVSGLAVPIPWLVVLWLVWAGGLVILVRVWRRRRAWTPVVALAAFAFWAAYLSAGSALFGWTA